MSYPYAPELKAPQRMPEIDPGKPAMAGMLKILCLTHQKQTAAFQPPTGLSCRRITISSADEAEIPCFVIEPGGEAGVLPGMLMIHGGAFYLPVQTSALAMACEYARKLRARVYLPEYRLVPEHAAPAQLEDCMAVWSTLCLQGAVLGADPSRLLVCGDSAGAALAAGLCILCRDRGLPLPRGQLLLYPALDDRAERYASYGRWPEAGWSPKGCRTMWDTYLKNAEDSQLPYLVPMRCENLCGLPPAYVEPQEIDILRDEGVAYAEALAAAGVPVVLNEVAGSYHGFDSDLASLLVQRVIARRIETAETFFIDKS